MSRFQRMKKPFVWPKRHFRRAHFLFETLFYFSLWRGLIFRPTLFSRWISKGMPPFRTHCLRKMVMALDIDMPKSSKSSSACSFVSVSSLTVMVSLSISRPPEADVLYLASKMLYKRMMFYCFMQLTPPLYHKRARSRKVIYRDWLWRASFVGKFPRLW